VPSGLFESLTATDALWRESLALDGIAWESDTGGGGGGGGDSISLERGRELLVCWVPSASQKLLRVCEGVEVEIRGISGGNGDTRAEAGGDGGEGGARRGFDGEELGIVGGLLVIPIQHSKGRYREADAVLTGSPNKKQGECRVEWNSCDDWQRGEHAINQLRGAVYISIR